MNFKTETAAVTNGNKQKKKMMQGYNTNIS